MLTASSAHSPVTLASDSPPPTPLELAQRAYDEFHDRTKAGEVLAADEFCQAQPAMCQELLRRFLSVHLALCNQPVSWFANLQQQLDPALMPWPECGEQWQGFLLDEAVADGGLARVYLAREVHAGGRPVVVKITQFETGEGHLQSPLAHDHIVPVLTVRHEKETGLTGIVMPYLGRTTLHDVLTELSDRRRRAAKETGVDDAVESRPVVHHWEIASGEIFAAVARRDLASDQVPECVAGATDFLAAVARLGQQLAAALEHTHAHQILHRDIKPSNILIDRDGRPLLMDFNLSARVDGAELVLGGTIPYMPSELLRSIVRWSSGDHGDMSTSAVVRTQGSATSDDQERSWEIECKKRAQQANSTLRAFETTVPEERRSAAGLEPSDLADPRSDLFSLGVVLYELVCGELPYGEPPRRVAIGEQAAAMELAQRQVKLEEQPSFLQLPSAWSEILRRCLAPDPAERFANAAELAVALKPLTESAGQRAVVPITMSAAVNLSPGTRIRQRIGWSSVQRQLQRLVLVASLVVALLPCRVQPWADIPTTQPKATDILRANGLVFPVRNSIIDISRHRPDIERRLFKDLMSLVEQLRLAVESPRTAALNIEECREQLEFMAAQSPYYQADIQGLIGYCHAYQGRHLQALQCWEKSLSVAAGTLLLDQFRAATVYAISLKQRGRLEESIHWSNWALDEANEDCDCLAAAAETSALSRFLLLEKFLAQPTVAESLQQMVQEASQSIQMALRYNGRSSVLVTLRRRLDELRNKTSEDDITESSRPDVDSSAQRKINQHNPLF